MDLVAKCPVQIIARAIQLPVLPCLMDRSCSGLFVRVSALWVTSIDDTRECMIRCICRLVEIILVFVLQGFFPESHPSGARVGVRPWRAGLTRRNQVLEEVAEFESADVVPQLLDFELLLQILIL